MLEINRDTVVVVIVIVIVGTECHPQDDVINGFIIVLLSGNQRDKNTMGMKWNPIINYTPFFFTG